MDIAEAGLASAHPADGEGNVVLATAADRLDTRFGPVPLDPAHQIRFRGGLPGFPQVELFQRAAIPGVDAELVILQAIEAPAVCFVAMPLPVDMSVIHKHDIESVRGMLSIDSSDLAILAIVSMVETPSGIEKFINLRAPLFIDMRRKVGAQVVLASPAYPLRHRLMPATA